jgi:hypothetical protein
MHLVTPHRYGPGIGGGGGSEGRPGRARGGRDPRVPRAARVRGARARRAWVIFVRIPDFMSWLYSILRSEGAHDGHAYCVSQAHIHLVACLGSLCCWSRIEIPIITGYLGNPYYLRFCP